MWPYWQVTWGVGKLNYEWTKGVVIVRINLLAPGRCGCNLKNIIFKLMSWTDILWAAIGVRWIPQNSIDDKPTLVQVMAWCHQATSHYLSQCRPRSMSPYGVTRPQWVKIRVPMIISSHVCLVSLKITPLQVKMMACNNDNCCSINSALTWQQYISILQKTKNKIPIQTQSKPKRINPLGSVN